MPEKYKRNVGYHSKTFRTVFFKSFLPAFTTTFWFVQKKKKVLLSRNTRRNNRTHWLTIEHDVCLGKSRIGCRGAKVPASLCMWCPRDSALTVSLVCVLLSGAYARHAQVRLTAVQVKAESPGSPVSRSALLTLAFCSSVTTGSGLWCVALQIPVPRATIARSPRYLYATPVLSTRCLPLSRALAA